MPEFDQSFYEIDVPDVDIPERCSDCPVQCDMHKELAKLAFIQHLMLQKGESLVGETGERLDKAIDEHLPSEQAEEVKRQIRQSTGDDLNKIDIAIQERRDEMEAAARGCDGVLKMRATKGNATYTASICTSARLNIRNTSKPLHVPTHLRVTDAK